MKNKLFLPLLLTFCLLLPVTAAAEATEAADTALDARTRSVHDVIRARIEAQYDDYATYYTPEEYRLMIDDYAGVFGGVGVAMVSVDDEVVVYSIINDTPAAASIIQAGDVIVRVDDTDITGYDTMQTSLLIRGEIGESVTLTLRGEDGALYEVTLIREEIISASVEGQMIAGAVNTAYFSINDFTEHSAEEFVEIFNQLRDEGMIDSIIFDLRSNSGGSFFAAINISNLFVPAGGTVVREKAASGIQEYTSSSGQLHGIRLVVLQNSWTASASEVLTGALRDEAGAVVIGDTSFGKGITQTVKPLTEGGYRYTRGRYYTPSGYDLHGVGIEPDIFVADPEGISAVEYFSSDPAKNPHLAAALDYLNN